ncbi:conserved hypothetical protein, partial [Streptomyces sviceus ATCC 29083]
MGAPSSNTGVEALRPAFGGETSRKSAPAPSGSATGRGLTEGGSMAEFTTGTQALVTERTQARAPATGGMEAPAAERPGVGPPAGERGRLDGAEASPLHGPDARSEA